MKLLKEKKNPLIKKSALKNYGATVSGDNQFHFLKTELHEISRFESYGRAPLLLTVTYPLSPELCSASRVQFLYLQTTGEMWELELVIYVSKSSTQQVFNTQCLEPVLPGWSLP